jgi:hypothetical protein
MNHSRYSGLGSSVSAGNVKNCTFDQVNSEIGRILLVSHRSVQRDWLTILAKRISRGERTFSPMFCYACATAGESWLRRSSRGIAAPKSQPGFTDALASVIAPCFDPKILCIIDLGIGDMVRTQAVLALALASRVEEIHFWMVDVNRSFIDTAIAGTMPSVMNTLRSIASGGTVSAFHGDYRCVRVLRSSFSKATKSCFLMMGNTLGMESRGTRVLRRLTHAMRRGDEVILEIQAVEPNRMTDSELTCSFRQDIEFYAGPLMALGAENRHIDIEASTVHSAHQEITSVNVILSTAVEVDGKVQVPPGKYEFISIRKYDSFAIQQIVRSAGLTIRRVFTLFANKTSNARSFHYISAYLE